MGSVKYEHVIRAVSETPWAVRPHVLATIVDLLRFRASGQTLTKDEIQARIGAGPSRRDDQVVGSVAVLPLWGVIAPKATMMSEMSGGTSLASFAASLRSAAMDDSVSAILLDIDSPGGSVDMVPETAAEIRAARALKPVVAVANTTAASAAYWLGSQASEFVVSPSAQVGSIGVFAAHEDLSKAADMEGVKTTLVSAGKFKTEGNPFEPLSDEARDDLQAKVDEFYGMFVADVAKGRGSSVAAVASGYGQGRMVLAEQAVAWGMVDRIAPAGQVLAELLQEHSGSRTNALASVTTDTATSTNLAHFTITYPETKTATENTNERRIGLDYAARSVAIHRRRLRLPAA